MTCKQVKALFSVYLDGALGGAEMHKVTEHLRSCPACHTQYESLAQVQSLLAALGRKQAPVDLALRIKVAVSQQRSISLERRVQRFFVPLQDSFNAFALPAMAGMVAAVAMIGMMIGFFALPQTVAASNDVPTTLYMPPKLVASPFSTNFTAVNADSPVVIEAFIDSKGRIEDYRIISGEDSLEVRKQLDRSLIFTVFEPAISFGKPAPGTVVISFSNVNVKG